MTRSSSPSNPIPTWARWAAIAWLAVWLPIYTIVWGTNSFLFLCDIAVVLTCVGLWSGSALLLSSQAVSSLFVDSMWMLDIAWHLIVGGHIIGGTDYFFDPHYPLGVRLLSTFHVALPIVLLTSLRRTGYDRRALGLQCLIAAVAMTASRIFYTEKNINFAVTDPIFHRTWGPAPVHVAFVLAALVVFIYLPTHLMLARFFPAPKVLNPQN